MTKLFKNGDNMGITTDAASEEEFLENVCSILAWLINEGRYEDVTPISSMSECLGISYTEPGQG